MGRRRFNPLRAKMHFSYTVEDVARLLRVHKNTVRSWLRSGLEAIDSSRPTMVQGRVLRAFLKNCQASRKQKCPPGTLYCLKCRSPKVPALAMVDFVPLTPSSGNLRALCEACSSIMHRHVQISRITAVMPKISVQFTHAESRLRESTSLSVNCDSGKASLA
jgi:hypothetical protein